MPEEQIRQLEERMRKLEAALTILLFSDRYQFQRDIQIHDGRSIILGSINGSKIGTNASQLLGFYNATPVSRRTIGAAISGITSSSAGTALAEPSGAYTQSEMQQNFRRIQDRLNDLRTNLTDLGLVA